MKKLTKDYLRELTYNVNGAAIEVHKTLGPGLLESVYHSCLKQELKLRNIEFQSEVKIPVIYKGININTNLRCDLFVENCLILELKAAQNILPIHEAQVMTYMKLSKVPKGVIYNFNVSNLFRDGQETYVNEYFRILPD
jgi:GxxExxY protein